MLDDSLQKLKESEPVMKKQDSTRSLTLDAASESLRARTMPPRTSGRRGSRRSRTSLRDSGHQSCPVITESDLDDLMKLNDEADAKEAADTTTPAQDVEKKISETDEESLDGVGGLEDVLDDSLHGENSRHMSFRRRSDESSGSLHLNDI
mmetsp:Transcript_2029/g.4112  ORF Transcript_2029/g.4112 Transcript_2029/m.4112 type:complete len:150 (+) Transcript_2029:114-563(+)|eukprot:CAMPEP_0168751132 /NCGR_PEP_ID=MMETSP0724-20121128/17657_1 /TAXON_ID=265536 /ORGANISM="Amphiprora sp., Strain CCMP467" /LENGTH=149 /DNA_ID=CAMNT_0008799229 /DNA_START=93 /DNA_END=542 /DNA_ORIENTATION=+